MEAFVGETRGRRQAMEDRWAVETALAGGVLVAAGVFDGHGGAACAEWMRKNFLAGLLARALGEGAPDVASALGRAAVAAEERLLTLAARDGLRDGTTCCAVAVEAGAVHCLNVGDSRAVLCRGGLAVPLSRDHKPDDAAEMRRILAAGGRVMSSRHRADPDGDSCEDCLRLGGHWRGGGEEEAPDTRGRRHGWLGRLLGGCASPAAASKAAAGAATRATPPADATVADDGSPRSAASTSSRASAGSRWSSAGGDDDRSAAAYAPCARHSGAARVWPGGLSVSRTLGDLPLKMSGCSGAGAGPLIARPDVTSADLSPADEFVLVASDGYWDVRGCDDAVGEARTLLRHHGGEDAAAIMARRAEESGSADNITVVIICL